MILPRWDEEDGRMKPVISLIHAIPLEDIDSMLHCAQRTCWCFPKPSPEDEVIILHHAVTTVKNGWVLIGERDDGQDGEVDHD